MSKSGRLSRSGRNAHGPRSAYPGAAGRGLCLGDTARLPYGTGSADSVLGVLEPGAVAACCATRTGRIAVIATESTVHLPVFAPLMAPCWQRA